MTLVSTTVSANNTPENPTAQLVKADENPIRLANDARARYTTDVANEKTKIIQAKYTLPYNRSRGGAILTSANTLNPM
jgi:hypothetical protein